MVLVQQAVDVSGQTGRGAHGVVPQDVDHIIQSVQSVLHLRLQTPRDKRFELLDVNCLKFFVAFGNQDSVFNVL